MAADPAYRASLVWGSDSLVWAGRSLAWDRVPEQIDVVEESLEVKADRARDLTAYRSKKGMHVSPGRFSAKTKEESKFYSLNWENGIADDVIVSAEWSSYPTGLAFSNQTISGALTRVKIGGGVEGTPYLVRCRVTLETSGEVLEASSGDTPGIPLEVLGFRVLSGGLGTLRDDYGRGPY